MCGLNGCLNEIKDCFFCLRVLNMDLAALLRQAWLDCNIMLLTPNFDQTQHVLLIISHFVKVCYIDDFYFVIFCCLVHMAYI